MMLFNKLIATSILSLATASAAFAAGTGTSTSAAPLSTKPNIISAASLATAIKQAHKAPKSKDASQIFGPYWVQFDPNYCNIAKVYLQGDQLFGTEVGCQDTLNQLYAAAVDPVSYNIYFTVPGAPAGTTAMWQVSLSQSLGWMSVTSLDTNGNLVPQLTGPYSVGIYTTQPSGAAY